MMLILHDHKTPIFLAQDRLFESLTNANERMYETEQKLHNVKI